uniref:Secreted protein n=1 Tax=Panagrolaimus sp. JU765 TaxID=591449 RepID=A0AC34QT41_9BILA
MKSFAVIFGFVAVFHLGSAGLPHLVGISDQKTLNVIDETQSRSFPLIEFDEELEEIPIVAAGSPLSAGSPLCDYPAFTALFTQWTIDAGLDQSVNYTNNGLALKAAVNKVLSSFDATDSNGAALALDKFCIAQRMFFQKLGVEQISGCINAAALLSYGYKRGPAYQTWQVLSQLNFQCGAAFSTYSSMVGQYLTVKNASSADLDLCGEQFIANLFNRTISGTNHGCLAMQIYNHCNAKVYYNAVQNLDLAWAVCESSRRANALTLPDCPDPKWFCQISQLTT